MHSSLSTPRLTISPLPNWLRTALGLLFFAWLVLLPGSYLARYGFGSIWFTKGYHSSLILTAAAWLHWMGRREGGLGRFALGIAVGMSLGCLADWRGGVMFIIPVFALGHMAYIFGCVSGARRLGLRNQAVWLGSLGLWLLLGVVLWWAVAKDAPKIDVFRWPSLGYTLWLASTAGTMTALALQDRRFTLMAIGAALFLASDAVLATRLFHEQPWFPDGMVWATYGPGQMLIVFGAIFVSERIARARLVEREGA